VIVTHESYDSVLVGTGKQKGLESLSFKFVSMPLHTVNQILIYEKYP